MEVILLERVTRLGAIGDVVKVKDGFARNFLIPQKKALRATDANKKVFEAKRADIEANNKKLRDAAEKHAKKLEGVSVTLVRQASEDGRLYGSVNARDIADALAAAGHEVDRKFIHLDNTIKTAGHYDIKVVLHPEVTITVKANITRSEAAAEEAPEDLRAKEDGEEDAA